MADKIERPRIERALPDRAGFSASVFDTIALVAVWCYGFVSDSDTDTYGRMALAFVIIDAIVQFAFLLPLMAAIRNPATIGPVAAYSLALCSIFVWGGYRDLPKGHELEALSAIVWVALGRGYTFVAKLRSIPGGLLARVLLPPLVTTILSAAAGVAMGMTAAFRSVSHGDVRIDPMLLAALVFYAMHAFVSLPFLQRRLQVRADLVE